MRHGARRAARPAARRTARRTTRRTVHRHRRRRRRRILVGGAVLLAVGGAAYGAVKLSQKDADRIEEHTGESVEEMTEEELVKNSGLDWTIIRAAAFTDGEKTGNYQHGISSAIKNLKLKISRADVADFTLKQLQSNNYLHQTPGLSY